MATVLSDDARRLLDGANFAHFSTVMPDGSPKVEPVWVMRENDLVLVATDGNSIKAWNVGREPRVAFSVVAYDDPYDHLLIRGSVVEVRDDSDLAVLDTLSKKYLGKPFPRRKWSERLVLVVKPKVAWHRKSPLRHAPPTSLAGQTPTTGELT